MLLKCFSNLDKDRAEWALLVVMRKGMGEGCPVCLCVYVGIYEYYVVDIIFYIDSLRAQKTGKKIKE